MSAPEIKPLVPLPREQALRKDEIRLRSLALPLAKEDPVIDRHLTAIFYAEDLYEIHAGAREAYEKKGPKFRHRADIHERHQQAAWQLKMHHLDQLAHLVS